DMTPSLPQRLLNEHDVATTCAISVATLRKWRCQKRGPRFVKVGGHLVRYRPEDLSAWIEGQVTAGSEGKGVARGADAPKLQLTCARQNVPSSVLSSSSAMAASRK